MTLTRQVLQLVATILGGAAILLTTGLSIVLLRGYQAIEMSLVEADLYGIEYAFQRELDAMHTIARDWAWWDDSCAFVATTNANFIASSLNYETIEQLDVDFLGFFHDHGEVIWAGRHNRTEKRLDPLPSFLLSQIAPEKPLLNLPAPNSAVTGLIQTPEGPLMVVVCRVLRSDRTVPEEHRGVFLIARLLDAAKVAEWGRILNLKLEVLAQDKAYLADNDWHLHTLPHGGTYYLRTTHNMWVSACIALKDLENKPIVYLRMTRPREIYGRARATILKFASTIATVVVLALILLFWTIRHFVVAPVQRIGAEIDNIAQTRDLSRRVAAPAHKELAGLASNVNDLLDSIRRAEEDLRRNAERLEKLNRCFLGFSADANKNITSLVQLAGQLLEADCALYNRLRGTLLCTLTDWRAPPDLQREDTPEGHLCFDVIAQGAGQVMVVRDLQRSRYAETDPNVRKYGLQTYIGYPVYCAGRCVGSLCCAYTRDVEISENDRKLVGIVAAAMGVEEERLEAETRLRESEEEWRRTFDWVPDPVCIIDEHFVIRRANAAMLRELGMPADQVIGRTCFECVHARGQVPESCPHAKVLETGREHTAEIVEEKLGGDCLVTCAPIHDAAGRVVGSVHISRNIRELKAKERQIRELLAESDRSRKALLSILEDERRIEAALRESEARFRDLVAMLPETIFECDYTGRITFANEFGLKQFGLEPEDIQRGFYVQDMVIPQKREVLLLDFQQRMAGELHGISEYPFMRRDGSVFPGALSVSLIRRADQVIGLRGICVDLTEHKKMEDLRIAKETAERINRAKSEFLAIMSHELRNPLHTITGFSKALEEGVYGHVTDKQHETLRHIAEAAEHLMQLISDILDMSRIEIGRIELAVDEVVIRPVVMECVELARGRDDAVELRFESFIAPELENAVIRVDRRRFRQVLLNLLSNAVKFSLPGGAIRVEVAPDPDDPTGKIRFAVKDEGVGVAPDEMEKIFERFQRGTPPDGKWREGAGLGLALAKELVRLHEGRIWAESGEGGRGLSVYFVLPVDGPSRVAA